MIDMSPEEFLQRALVIAAEGVCDTLEACSMSGSEYAFSLVVWKIGHPEKPAIISGASGKEKWVETSAALIAASKKSETQPLVTGTHKSPRKN